MKKVKQENKWLVAHQGQHVNIMLISYCSISEHFCGLIVVLWSFSEMPRYILMVSMMHRVVIWRHSPMTLPINYVIAYTPWNILKYVLWSFYVSML